MATAFPPWLKRLLAKAKSYPGAVEDHPWGDTVVKVNKKVFVFLGGQDGRFGLSTKLPQSAGVALMLPFAEPTGYGLGKSGWVSASFGPGEDVPEGVLVEWIDESYRAIAPKKLVKELDGAPPAAPPAKKRRPSTRRT